MCKLNIYICIGYILPTIGGYMTVGGCLCALRALGRGSAGLGTMCQLNTCTCIGYILPTFGEYMTVGWCLCALWALGWETNKYFKKFPWCQIVHGAKLSAVPNCPRCQIVHFTLRCQIVRGAKLSAVPNCPWCQIVHFYPWCQIVRQHGRCQIVRGAKLSWCQIVLGPSQ